MIAHISGVNIHLLLKRDQYYGASGKSYCGLGFSDLAGLFHFCGRLGRPSISRLLRIDRIQTCECAAWVTPKSRRLPYESTRHDRKRRTTGG